MSFAIVDERISAAANSLDLCKEIVELVISTNEYCQTFQLHDGSKVNAGLSFGIGKWVQLNFY